MKNYKFEINETLYPVGCSEEYKQANPFVVAERRKVEIVHEGEDGNVTHFLNQYSENGLSWYLESSLER